MRCREVPCPAVWCGRALPCGAVLCGAVPFCAVLHAVPYLLFRACQVSFEEVVSCSSTEVQHTRFVHTTMFSHKKFPPSSALAQQRAAQRRPVPCLEVQCGAVRRCAFFRRHSVGCYAKYQVPLRTCVLAFLLCSVNVLPLCPLHIFSPRKLHTVLAIKTRHRQQAHSTAHGY